MATAPAPLRKFYIVDTEQIAMLASPRRQEILDRLAAAGPLTVKDLARSMGVGVHGLYYHLRALCRVGLAVEVGQQADGRKSESLFRARAPRMMLRRAIADPANHEALRGVAGALAERLRSDYAVALESPQARGEGEGRTIALTRLLGRPSEGELREINACLERISEILWESAGSTEPPTLSLGWIMAPVDREVANRCGQSHSPK